MLLERQPGCEKPAGRGGAGAALTAPPEPPAKRQHHCGHGSGPPGTTSPAQHSDESRPCHYKTKCIRDGSSGPQRSCSAQQTVRPKASGRLLTPPRTPVLLRSLSGSSSSHSGYSISELPVFAVGGIPSEFKFQLDLFLLKVLYGLLRIKNNFRGEILLFLSLSPHIS